MSLNLPFGIKVINPLPLDHYYLNGGSPYADVATANGLLPSAIRYIGMTVNINGEEYWYKSGILDVNLVKKIESQILGYTHVQGSPSVTWNIPHGLGREPIIEIRDNSGNVWEAEKDHTDNNNAVVTLAFAMAGVAECR